MLKIFEKASGQQINIDKSSVFYSRNCSAQLKSKLYHQLQIREANGNSLYLGLPNMITGKKSAVFGYIKERLQGRMKGWDKRCLSKGGKEVLIKSVGQSLPSYSMSVFLLPLEVCKELEMAMSKFWWRSDASKDKNIHWMCWERLCSDKSKGGMGFRCLRDFNIALLGKQAWRLASQPNKLVSKVFKARYYPSGSFLTAKLGANPSYIWRSVLEAQNLIAQGISCRVGDGQDIDILNSPWLPCSQDPYIHTFNESINHQKVASLMRIGERIWDEEIIKDVFEERDAELILAIPLHENVKDTWYWRYEKMGQYSVKSAYVLIQNSKTNIASANNSGFWRKLWQLKLPSKVKNFLWRAASGCLPTKELLRTRKVQVNELCPICNADLESVIHALVSCTFADHCHKLVGTSFSVSVQANIVTFVDWLQSLFDHQHKNMVDIHVTLCWKIWKNRNDTIWKQRNADFSEIVNSTISLLNQWRSVQDNTFDPFLGFMSPEDGNEQWYPPEDKSVKINVDAAIFEDPRRYSYAFLARDHMGSLIEANSKCLPGRVTPEFAEALGIREALSWTKQKKYSNVILETDCLQVVQLIRSSFSSLSYLGRVIEDCRTCLSDLSCQNVVLRFVRRSANNVAHYLARYSSSIADRIWRVTDVHPEFDFILRKDLIK